MINCTIGHGIEFNYRKNAQSFFGTEETTPTIIFATQKGFNCLEMGKVHTSKGSIHVGQDLTQVLLPFFEVLYSFFVYLQMDFEWEDREDGTPLYVHMLAGSAAGISEHLSMIPVDNVKTHCQVGRSPILEIVQRIYKAGGLNNFYAGSSVVAVGCAPAHAIYFSIYEAAKVALDCKPEQDNAKFALVGAFSAMFHDLIMNPTETLKQRVQLLRDNNPKINTCSVARSIYRNQGLKAFYRSFTVSYAMNIPFGSLLVLANQKLKHLFGVKEKDNGAVYYVCGGLAGGIASIPTTPLDVIKTRLNTQTCTGSNNGACNFFHKKAEKVKLREEFEFRSRRGLLSAEKSMFSTVRDSNVKYHNVTDTAQIIWREEGAMGFFRGLQMRMAIQSLSSGVAWGTYQLLKRVLLPERRH